MTTTQTEIEQIVTTSEPEPRKDEPKLRHIVRPYDNLHMAHIFHNWKATEGSDIVEVATTRGIEIQALCGHRWIPTRVVTAGLKTCDACMETASKIMESGE